LKRRTRGGFALAFALGFFAFAAMTPLGQFHLDDGRDTNADAGLQDFKIHRAAHLQ